MNKDTEHNIAVIAQELKGIRRILGLHAQAYMLVNDFSPPYAIDSRLLSKILESLYIEILSEKKESEYLSKEVNK